MFRFIAVAALFATACAAQDASFSNTVAPVLRAGCIPCHNAKSNSGGLDLHGFDKEETLVSGRDVWLRVLRRMKAGQMPPRNAPKPEGLAGMIAWLDRELGQNERE